MLETICSLKYLFWWNKFTNTSSSARSHVLRQVRREISLRNIYTLQRHPNDLKKIILLSSHQTPNFMIRLLISIVPTHNLGSDIFMHYLILADGVAINLIMDFCNCIMMFLAKIIMIAARIFQIDILEITWYMK